MKKTTLLLLITVIIGALSVFACVYKPIKTNALVGKFCDIHYGSSTPYIYVYGKVKHINDKWVVLRVQEENITPAFYTEKWIPMNKIISVSKIDK